MDSVVSRNADRFRTAVALLGIASALSLAPAFGQGLGSSGTIQGSVLDPSGGALQGATVKIRNAVSGYERSTVTDDAGRFAFLVSDS